MSGLDSALMEWLRASHAPWLDTVMSVLTISGIMAGIWQLVALVSLFLPGKRAAAWRVLLAVWLALFRIVQGASKKLRRVDEEHEEALRRWEQNLRDREEELRKDKPQEKHKEKEKGE